jgi:hypothetical protein
VSGHDAQDDDALRLLRAINVERAHGRVGSLVYAFAAVHSASLRPGTERFEEALWCLVWEGRSRWPSTSRRRSPRGCPSGVRRTA